MKQAIIQEIINDIIAIDPDLKNIKSELEKLVQELIDNKPQTPFTKEFKDSLKAQIIWAINEQRIVHEEENKWDRSEIFHSLKFWMIWFSTVTAWFLIFTLFYYFEDIQQPATQITYIENYSNINKTESNEMKEKIREEQDTTKEISTTKQTPTVDQGGGASNSVDNVIMLAIPETNLEPEMKSFSINDEPIAEYEITESPEEYSIMTKTAPLEDDYLARREFAPEEATATIATSPTLFCETSNQFLLANNITQNTTKTFTYENQIYKATINFTSNSIKIEHIGTQDDSKIQTEIPNLNLFFERNNFNIKSDYLSPIIEESENIIEYYYPKNNQQEGMTVRIDKINNIIFSIQNICLYQ